MLKSEAITACPKKEERKDMVVVDFMVSLLLTHKLYGPIKHLRNEGGGTQFRGDFLLAVGGGKADRRGTFGGSARQSAFSLERWSLSGAFEVFFVSTKDKMCTSAQWALKLRKTSFYDSSTMII